MLKTKNKMKTKNFYITVLVTLLLTFIANVILMGFTRYNNTIVLDKLTQLYQYSEVSIYRYIDDTYEDYAYTSNLVEVNSIENDPYLLYSIVMDDHLNYHFLLKLYIGEKKQIKVKELDYLKNN